MGCLRQAYRREPETVQTARYLFSAERENVPWTVPVNGGGGRVRDTLCVHARILFVIMTRCCPCCCYLCLPRKRLLLPGRKERERRLPLAAARAAQRPICGGRHRWKCKKEEEKNEESPRVSAGGWCAPGGVRYRSFTRGITLPPPRKKKKKKEKAVCLF